VREHIDHATAELWQSNSDQIAAILLETVTAAAQREGRLPVPSDLSEVVATLLAAAWRLMHFVDPFDADGMRATRYAALLRAHADSVEREG
jgi:hypothetical protein